MMSTFYFVSSFVTECPNLLHGVTVSERDQVCIDVDLGTSTNGPSPILSVSL